MLSPRFAAWQACHAAKRGDSIFSSGGCIRLRARVSRVPAMGRLVITHSTYLEGLIPCLKRLSRVPEIDTITPAVISRVKGRAPELRLKVSIPIRGGWKLVARRGSSAQEVFVVTGLSALELEERIQSVLTR